MRPYVSCWHRQARQESSGLRCRRRWPRPTPSPLSKAAPLCVTAKNRNLLAEVIRLRTLIIEHHATRTYVKLGQSFISPDGGRTELALAQLLASPAQSLLALSLSLFARSLISATPASSGGIMRPTPASMASIVLLLKIPAWERVAMPCGRLKGTLAWLHCAPDKAGWLRV